MLVAISLECKNNEGNSAMPRSKCSKIQNLKEVENVFHPKDAYCLTNTDDTQR